MLHTTDMTNANNITKFCLISEGNSKYSILHV